MQNVRIVYATVEDSRKVSKKKKKRKEISECKMQNEKRRERDHTRSPGVPADSFNPPA